MIPSTLARTNREEIFGVAIVVALIALAIAFGAQRGRRAVPTTARAREVTELAGPVGRFVLSPASGRLSALSADGRRRVDLELSLVVDGVERPLVMHRGDVTQRDKATLIAALPIEVGQDRANGTLELRLDPASDLLTANLTITPEVSSASHTYALRTSVTPEGRSVFVPGTGELADLGAFEARSVVIDDDAHPIAVLSTSGWLTVEETPPDVENQGARPRLVVTSRVEAAGGPAPSEAAAGAAPSPAPAPSAAHLEISALVGSSSQKLWGRLYRLLRVPVAGVSGVVAGLKDRALVVALDEDGRPLLRSVIDPHGRFALEAPMTAVQWYASLEAAHTSAPVRFSPGTPGELKLDVSPGGELHVRVIDADTGKRLVTRLLVKGIEGTIDPNFGPDFRASGAGPLMDMRDGEVVTPLPAGRYRVSATKGLEWSIDSENVEILSGKTRSVDLALRHIVNTPGMVGCDLHVHARPSFDTPVTAEDRVLSLISAGVDFAVPTEHNVVGDYAPALEVQNLTGALAFVPGVEVTTYNPRFGHFGVFPWPLGSVPPYRGTTAGGLLAAARRGDPTRVVQIHHPRLPMGIGYFLVAGFDPHSGRAPAGMRTDFDLIEVYNGFDLGSRPRVEQVLEDWFTLLNLGKRIAATGSSDSHRIQYQWAGYPRTYAYVDPKAAGDTGQPIDTPAVVAALKKGRSFVTSGPIVDFEVSAEGKIARPGDELPSVRGGELRGTVRVRAAPWVDVTSVEILAGVSPDELDARRRAASGAVPATTPSAPGRGVAGAAASHAPAPLHAPRGTAPARAGDAPLFGSVVIWKAQVPSRPMQLGDEAGTLDEAAGRAVRFEGAVSGQLPVDTRWVIAVVRGERSLDDALPFMIVQPLAFTNPIWLGPRLPPARPF